MSTFPEAAEAEEAEAVGKPYTPQTSIFLSLYLCPGILAPCIEPTRGYEPLALHAPPYTGLYSWARSSRDLGGVPSFYEEIK